MEIQAVIFAGGRGTRLRPLTDNIPKPMVDVNGKPFLEHLILYLKGQGIKKFLLLVGYKRDVIMDYFKDGSSLGVLIEYSIEDTPLGTAKALNIAREKIDDIFLVINGDTFVLFEMEKLVDMIDSGTCGVLCVNVENDSKNNVKIENDFVVDYSKNRSDGMNAMNSGVGIFLKTCLGLVNENDITYEESLFKELARRKELKVYYVKEIYDMGTFDGLNIIKDVLK